MGDEEKQGKDHLKEGKEQLEKGTQKVLKEGYEKGREKTDYYRKNRSDMVGDISQRFSNTKKPAISGTIVLLPVLVVLFVVDWLFEKIVDLPGSAFFEVTTNYYVNQSLKLATLLILGAIVVTGVGRLTETKRGFQFEKIIDKIFDKIPFLGAVYNITKVTTETVMGGGEDLSEPVKVDYNGFRVTGFKTGNSTEDGREVVFIPTAPNITSGLVVELDDEKLQETDETAEEALTRQLSAGFGQTDREISGEDN